MKQNIYAIRHTTAKNIKKRKRLNAFLQSQRKSMECATSSIETWKTIRCIRWLFLLQWIWKSCPLGSWNICLHIFYYTKIAKAPVYTLSKEETDTFVYSMIFLTSTFTPAVGLEPTTSWLTVMRYYQLSYAGITSAWRRPTLTRGNPSLQSALRSLTSVFGMVTGVSFSLSPPHCGVIFYWVNFVHSKLDLKSHKFFSEFFSFNLLVKSSID